MVPQDYWPGLPLIPIIALAYYFNFLYSFPVSYELFYEKTKKISLGTIIAAIINIIGNFILIPYYGEMGAAVATLISFIFLFIIHEIIVLLIIKDYDYRIYIFFKPLVLVVIVCGLFYLTINLWYIRWGIGLILGIYLLQRIIKTRSII
jgi:O-antigen/teichoic acid export membrane protein